MLLRDPRPGGWAADWHPTGQGLGSAALPSLQLTLSLSRAGVLMVMGLPLSSPVACFVSERCKPAHHRATSTGSFAADFWLLLELLAKDLQQFFNNPFPIIGIRRFSNTNLRIIGGVAFAVFQ